jgi:RHS repeat-associated protein
MFVIQEPGVTGTISFTYNDENSRTTTTYPNGVRETVSYDPAERATAISGQNLQTSAVLTDFEYLYTQSGSTTERDLLIQEQDHRRGTTTDYSYDELNRLTDADTTGTATYSYGYEFDNASNRTRRTSSTNPQATTYAYDPGNKLCWHHDATVSNPQCSAPPAQAVTYSYDPNGNLTATSAGLQLDYNALNQTASIEPPGQSPIPLAYAHSGQTERTDKAATEFTDTVLGLSAEKTAGDTTRYTRDEQGQLLGLRQPGGRQYPLFDRLGSIVALTDASGNVDARYVYKDPYGADIDTSGTASSPFRFAGEYLDTETGLYKIGARYYQPAHGRWTQLDPLDHAGDLRQANRYGYAGDDPINLTDPSGKALPGVAAVAAAGAIRYGIARASASAAAQSARATVSRVAARTTTGTAGRIRRVVEDNVRDAAEFVGDLLG